MSNLMPWTGDSSNLPEGFKKSEGKALQAATNRQIAAGIVAGARLNVGQYVTATAIGQTGSLARYAIAEANGDPWIAQHTGSLVATFADLARAEIRGLGGFGPGL
jgi:hypothetical protein